MTRGKGVRPFGEHVDDLIPVYFAEITSVSEYSATCIDTRTGEAPIVGPCIIVNP